MRIAGSLLVAVALLAGACTGTTSPDEECITAGGICFVDTDESACNAPIGPNLCSTGYTCCTSVDPYNYKNGMQFDGGPAPVFDTGVDGDANEAGHDGSGADATKVDAATDATKADATDAKTDG